MKEYKNLPGFVATDGFAELEYPEAESHQEAAEEYVETGEWGDRTSTQWIDVVVAKRRVLPNGEIERFDEESVTVTLSAEEPPCLSGYEHEWVSPLSVVGGCQENPGVFASGGGARSVNICKHCGIYREDDTWAQRGDTGEQGLYSVSYRQADEKSLEWVETKKNEQD